MPSDTPVDVHRPGRGGWRGGGRPRIPTDAKYLLNLSHDDLRWCMAQRGKAAAFLRRLIAFARALDLSPDELESLLSRPDALRRALAQEPD